MPRPPLPRRLSTPTAGTAAVLDLPPLGFLCLCGEREPKLNGTAAAPLVGRCCFRDSPFAWAGCGEGDAA